MILTSRKAPCKGCTDRCAEPNCHTTCPRYLAFRAAIDAGVAERYVKISLDDYTFDTVRRKQERARHAWKPYRSRMN